MSDQPEELNPYKAPAPETKVETSVHDEAQQERTRWIAICMLNGSAVFIIGIFLVGTPNRSVGDDTIFKIIGGSMVAVALAMFAAGPLISNWLKRRIERMREDG